MSLEPPQAIGLLGCLTEASLRSDGLSAAEVARDGAGLLVVLLDRLPEAPTIDRVPCDDLGRCTQRALDIVPLTADHNHIMLIGTDQYFSAIRNLVFRNRS